MYTPIIGLEIHLQLKTKSKIFCKCSTAESEPNTNICPICLAYPGAMPNLNQEAVMQSIRMGIALGSEIALETNWDRKSYMYPDLFKGYQISQLDQPICGPAEIDVIVRDRRNYYSKDNYTKKIGIFRAHLEEDTAKSIHGEGETLLDANKAGVPLLEVVSMPDMHSVDEAVSFAKSVRNLARWFGVCDGNLELGQMRFDASISIALEDFDKNTGYNDWKGVKHTPIVEIKNLNSFGNLQDSLDYEINRQIKAYELSKEQYTVGSKETRGWNDKIRETYIQRKKEEANEYRFIPEPDIPTLIIHPEDIEDIKNTLPAHPNTIRKELLSMGDISSQSVDTLLENIDIYKLFIELYRDNDSMAGKIANSLANELLAEISEKNLSKEWKEELREVFVNLSAKKISGNELKEIFKLHKSGESDWGDILKQILSTESVDPIEVLKKAILENPGVVEQIKSGKDSAKMFFVGLVMRETKGKADANQIKDLIDSLL
jgi:aspartyl-tRNA(Asn)/glutamyl-tRNA(Gln) amidotransferase subunit B